MERLIAASLAILALTLALLPYSTAAESITVHIRHARLGPVYQKLPDGRVIELYADVYYPDTLYLHQPNILGEVNVTVYTNWTGPWDGIITVMIVDPGYQIDPTTFKPTNSMYAWATGGATIGAGDILAPEGAVVNKTRITRRIQLVAHMRYFEAKPGTYPVQYFLRVRVAYFDPKTLEKLPGGDINMYTVSAGAPHAKLIVPAKSQPGNQLEPILVKASVFGAAAAAAYIAVDYIYRRRRR